MLLAAALLIQLVTQVETAPALPPKPRGPASEIRDALITAELEIMRAEVCADSRPRYAGQLEPVRTRFTAVWTRAQPLYGRGVTPPFGGVDFVVSCRRGDRARYLRRAEQAVSRARSDLERRLAGLDGLWLGPFRLCRDTVESVRLVEDFDGSMQPVIRFAPAVRGAIRAETETRTGQPMGVYLDGKLLFAPIVQEPMAAEMQISGPGGAGQTGRMRAAAALPC